MKGATVENRTSPPVLGTSLVGQEDTFAGHGNQMSGFSAALRPGTGVPGHFRTLGSTIEHTRYPPLLTVVIWPDPCQDPGE